jgi:hypothetical protein
MSINDDIRQADQRLTEFNDKVTNYDPLNHTLWHPESPGIDRMPMMEGVNQAIDDVGKTCASIADECTAMFRQLDTQFSNVLGSAQSNSANEVKALSSFSDTVAPALQKSVTANATVCDKAFQMIRQSNAKSRQAISESNKHGTLLGLPNPFSAGSVSSLDDGSSVVPPSMNEAEEASAAVTDAVAAWADAGSRAGIGGGITTPGPGPINDEKGPGIQPNTGGGNHGGGNTGGGRVTGPSLGGGGGSHVTGPDTSGGITGSDTSHDSGSGPDRSTSPFSTAPDDAVPMPEPLPFDEGLDTGLGDGGSGIDTGMDTTELGTGFPDPDPGIGDDSMLQTPVSEGDGSLDDGSDDPTGIETHTSGWTPPEEDDVGSDDADDNDVNEGAGDGGAAGIDSTDGGGDAAGGDGAAGDGPEGDNGDKDSGVFGDNLDGDLPPGGASTGGDDIADGGIDSPEMGDGPGIGVNTPEMGDGIFGGDGDKDGVTAEIDGKEVTFPDQQSADMAEALAGDGGGSLRDAAADAGFDVPADGEDIGRAIDPSELQPGDVVATSDGDYVYLGNDEMMGDDGQVVPMDEEHVQFDDAHQGFFRLEGGDAADPDAAPTAGAEASGSPDAPSDPSGGGTSSAGSEPTEASSDMGEAPERRDDAPVGLGAGQLTPDTDTGVSSAADQGADSPVDQPAGGSSGPADAPDADHSGASDGSAAGTFDESGPLSAAAGDGADSPAGEDSSSDTPNPVAGATASTTVGGTGTSASEGSVDANSIIPD